jgi:hypothetical protein
LGASRRAPRRQRAPRALRPNRRQSSPANRAAIRAGDIRITPSRTLGQTNRSACPFDRWRAMPHPSRRLRTSTIPVWSQTRSLIRSARFERNTETARKSRTHPGHRRHRQRQPVDALAEVHWPRRHEDLHRPAPAGHPDAAARAARTTRVR